LPDGLLQHSLSSGGFNGSDINLNLQVNFASEENASMVYTALSVDKEPADVTAAACGHDCYAYTRRAEIVELRRLQVASPGKEGSENDGGAFNVLCHAQPKWLPVNLIWSPSAYLPQMPPRPKSPCLEEGSVNDGGAFNKRLRPAQMAAMNLIQEPTDSLPQMPRKSSKSIPLKPQIRSL
ncbi:hypothetical protein KI387_007826, partial [Taxus chinensis]